MKATVYRCIEIGALSVCAAAVLLAGPGRAVAQEPSVAVQEEKIATPTVEKQIAEVKPDGTLMWGDVADAEAGVEVPYRVVGTLPSNWDDFDTYHYEFSDALDPQLVIDLSSVKITLGGGSSKSDITAGFHITLSEDNVLTVATQDLKAVAPEATRASTVTLTYTAHLDPALAVPGMGDPADNYVHLAYTAKPGSSGIGRTVEDWARLLTWGIDLQKVSSGQGVNLAGAVFTVQDADGRHVRADGTLSDDPVEHVTDGAGMIRIVGMDSGVYTITEVRAPKGYRKLAAPLTVTLSSTLAPNDSSVHARVLGVGAETGASRDDGVPCMRVVNASLKDPAPSGLAQTGDNAVLVASGVALAGACCIGAALATHRNARQQGEGR